MKNIPNPTYCILVEILEAAQCLSPRDDADAVLFIPTRAWASSLFKSASGRTEHVAVIVFLDIVRCYVQANDSRNDERAVVIDRCYYATDFCVTAKKLEAALALLQGKNALNLFERNGQRWGVPRADAVAQVMLPPMLLRFYRQWNAWQTD